MRRLLFSANKTLCAAARVLKRYVLATSTDECIILLLCVLILHCKQRKKVKQRRENFRIDIHINEALKTKRVDGIREKHRHYISSLFKYAFLPKVTDQILVFFVF